MRVCLPTPIPAAVVHDGVKRGDRLVAACSVLTWRERAHWQAAPTDRLMNCPRCHRLRELVETGE